MALFAEESLDLRGKLAYACRILAAHGQNDAIYGHVTHRLPGAESFWMKPAGMGLDEITPERLIRMTLDGQVLEGGFPRHLEYPIHAEIFRARPEITSVIHTHPPYSIAFAATEQPLRAISHEGCMFTPPDVPRFTLTSNLIVTRQLGEALAATLGSARACFLVNHGIVVAAETKYWLWSPHSIWSEPASFSSWPQRPASACAPLATRNAWRSARCITLKPYRARGTITVVALGRYEALFLNKKVQLCPPGYFEGS
jgi:ribulose-5-phosphate 4-epimerase/fuculose-1-phosphate aldolase